MAQKNMRTRNLDHSKPMVIYDATKNDLPDKMDQQGITRTTNILPTGIEKEEETELHLQMALNAVQNGYSSKEAQGIPVPKVEDIAISQQDIANSQHDVLYPVGYSKEKELYRVQGLSAGPEPDVVDYCIDEADEVWLKECGARLGVSVDRFEGAIDRLEKATGAQIMSESDAAKLLKDKPDIVSGIYSYWLAKRRRSSHGLISRVRTETKRESGSGHDPYIAFRRRAEKMQTRKNRKSDEQNYILMFKMRIAHTQLMRDGLMDILKGVRERETLKLRTSLMERHEFQLASNFFDDPAGFYQGHLLDNYPELNRIEAETFADFDYDDEADTSEAGVPVNVREEQDSLEEFSEVSDSGNESDSWSHIHHPDLKNRSPHFDLERDESNFAVAAPADPNLVPESQYKGEDPPEYWGLDGEFTFVPRKDCKYLQPKEECDITEFDQPEDPLRGFFLQEIPIVVGRVSVMKTVLCRRTFGRNGTKLLEYYKLPDCLDELDLSLLLYQEDTVPSPLAPLSDKLFQWKNVIQDNKEKVFLHSEPAIKQEYPLPEEPVRWNLTEEDVEDLFQAALRWPLDSETHSATAAAAEEDVDQYQIACTSVCQPLEEHSYCRQPIYGDLSWLDGQISEGDTEDVPSSHQHTDADLASVDSGAADSVVPPGNSSPATSLEGEFAVPVTPGLSVSETARVLVNGKLPRKPATKKPKASAAKPAAASPDIITVAVGNGGLKRSRLESAVGSTPPGLLTDSGAATKKPARKRAKPGSVVAESGESPPQSENVVLAKAFDFQVPQLPPPQPTAAPSPLAVALVNQPAKRPAVKRKSPPKKTAPSMLDNGKTDVHNGDDLFPNKMPKRTQSATKKGQKDDNIQQVPPPSSVTMMPQPLFTPTAPPKTILPFTLSTAPVTAQLTFNSTPRTATALNNGSPASTLRLTTASYSNPQLHSLLTNSSASIGGGGGGGGSLNGYHNVGAGSVHNGVSLVVHTPSKLY